MFREKKNCIVITSLIFIGLFVEVLELIAVFFTSKNSINHPLFSIMYLTSSLIQFLILFYTCMVLTRILFAKNIDPDNNAIPLLTALGDLTGTVFLAISLMVYKIIIKQHTL
uniref:SLC41A/MgtE integral membrane domain-containing protein n=1 Tax=Panagrolaimus sp. JU765 TaxID=591449 RepID=A0AC34RIM7_9BILA